MLEEESIVKLPILCNMTTKDEDIDFFQFQKALRKFKKMNEIHHIEFKSHNED